MRNIKVCAMAVNQPTKEFEIDTKKVVRRAVGTAIIVGAVGAGATYYHMTKAVVAFLAY